MTSMRVFDLTISSRMALKENERAFRRYAILGLCGHGVYSTVGEGRGVSPTSPKREPPKLGGLQKDRPC